MSIELIENEIRRFLASDEPEVICISGRWGVGKTFAWKRFLEDAQRAKAIKLGHYAYVSLFGVNSLEEFKRSIFENSVNSSEIGLEPSLKTLGSNFDAVAKSFAMSFGRKAFGFLQQLPAVKNYVGSLGSGLFFTITKAIVCVDDIERTGEGLTIREVLGLAAYLKEFKRCKVVLILNDEALDAEKEDFRKYFEKVVDASLRFAPSAEDCVRIAVDVSIDTNKLLAESCAMLGISNIRLIKRVERSVHQIEPLLRQFDDQVLNTAVQTLALLGWCIYDPGNAPTLEYLRRRGQVDPIGTKKSTVPENEAAWNALLSAYRFTGMDEFDDVLLCGIRNGYFDPLLLRERAAVLDKQFKANKLNSSVLDAWDLYHGTFENNEKEALDAIYRASVENIENVNLGTLSGTVSLLKEFGRKDQAEELIRLSLASRGNERELFNIDNFMTMGQAKDPDVVRAFTEKYASLCDKRNPKDILLSVERSWNPEDITTLSSLSVDEYYSIFKNAKGRDLRSMLNAVFQFDRIANVSQPTMKEIPIKARQALKRIGQESAINARRVRQYGIEVDAQFTPEQPQGQ